MIKDKFYISFEEGDVKAIKITVPDTLSLNDKIAKIQVRREAGSSIVLNFGTNVDNSLLHIDGQELHWLIPAFMTIGKAGVYQWELVIYTNNSDAKRRARGIFEIIPSIAKI